MVGHLVGSQNFLVDQVTIIIIALNAIVFLVTRLILAIYILIVLKILVSIVSYNNAVIMTACTRLPVIVLVFSLILKLHPTRHEAMLQDFLGMDTFTWVQAHYLVKQVDEVGVSHP